MYNKSKDDYECDFCGRSFPWESPPPDGMRGGYQMWYCEECSKDFCRDCFTNKHGESAFHEMLSNKMVLCPDCWNKAVISASGEPIEDIHDIVYFSR